MDFSGSSKPGLPKELQSFSQEFAPQSSLVQQELARYVAALPCLYAAVTASAYATGI